MTDLNLVYGFQEPEQQQIKQINIKPVEQIQEPIQSHATPPEIPYQQNGINAMNNMYMQQEGQNNGQKKYQPSYSFWDRMVLKRPDVMKLSTLSLVFLMAIAFDRIGTHYINKYLTDNIFTDIQEFIIRLSYPILIFIILWIVKSL
jgi:hypothetical protein